MKKTVVLIIDDDPNVRQIIAYTLGVITDYETLEAQDGAEAFSLLQENDIDLALIDLGLPDISGLDVLSRIKAEHPSTAAIILTGNATLESAIEATNRGAFSFLQKPYQIGQLMLQVKRAIEKKQADQEHEKLNIQLMQAQKMESVGRLAAGIAHEINTPIQFISTNISFLNEAFKESSQLITSLLELHESIKKGEVTEAQIKENDQIIARLDWDYLREEIPRAIDQSNDGLQRVTSIVQAMKEFSHPGNKQKDTADLNRIIETTITISRNEWKYVATVATDLDPELLPLPCLANELGQVFLNLIINAAHAIANQLGKNPEGEKGLITISTKQYDQHVEIRITDTGCGIPTHIHNKVFDPFFTTKDIGKGTGQGLTIAHDVIVGKHNGTIDLESEPGSGSTFIIRLPRDQA
ncbi:MAG: response regulator [Desulfocapsaceae bacterium]|nr:response regulator [Desulfocapsaceae bacterium]